MSHIGPDQGNGRHRKAECRKGRHRFGESQSIGAGIVRRVCQTCSAVTIDLTSAGEMPVVASRRQIRSMGTRS